MIFITNWSIVSREPSITLLNVMDKILILKVQQHLKFNDISVDADVEQGVAK